MQAAGERGEAEEQDHRPKRGERLQDRLRANQVFELGRAARAPREAGAGVNGAEHQPQQRAEGGGDDRRGARPAHLQRLDDRADRRAIVVGRLVIDQQGFDIVLARQAARGRGFARLLRFRRDRLAQGGFDLRLAAGGAGVPGVARQVQCVLDRRHRRGNRVLSRVLLRHDAASSLSSHAPSRRENASRGASGRPGYWPRAAAPESINHAVYRSRSEIETSAESYLSNVVNGSLTMMADACNRRRADFGRFFPRSAKNRSNPCLRSL